LFKREVAFYVLLTFAILNTSLLGLSLLRVSPWTPPPAGNSTSFPQSPSLVTLPLIVLQNNSIALFPISWGAVVGAWIWRGRAKSDWSRRGLDQGLFKLLLQMKGGETRTTILKALLTPKDRFQLARDLELDWTTIDYHIQVLLKYGLVREKTAYGNVKLYELTPTGDTLLNALEEMSRRPK
jgi:predicted transcriptional regulator